MKNVNLSKLSIQNFKAFGEMVDVPIRPITLIFGENSAGKSSILHSLLFLQQMKYQPPSDIANISFTKAGGNSVDLGGIPHLKHNHTSQHSLRFTIEVHVASDTISIDIQFSSANTIESINYSINQHYLYSLHSFTTNINRMELQYKIAGLSAHTISYLASLKSFNEFLNPESPLSQSIVNPSISEIIHAQTWEHYCAFVLDYIVNHNVIIESLQCVHQHHMFAADILYKSIKNTATQFSLSPSFTYGSANSHMRTSQIDSSATRAFEIIITWLFEYIDYITKYAFNQISSIDYTGPIRIIPSRNFDVVDNLQKDDSTGMSAWDELSIHNYTRTRVNHWLEVFGTSKQIILEQFINLAHIHQIISLSSSKSITNLLDSLPKKQTLRFHDPVKNINLSHRDLGVGISQVIPVIVNCVANTEIPVLIEQPELHLHPRLQGDLADLFIETAIKGDQLNTYVIETHSEHIIRRIMRRIREDRNKGTDEVRITKDDVAILYVAPGPNGSTVTHLRLDDEGDLIDEWPNGFFEESFRDDMAGR